ncbi:hypothetical protein N9C00_00025 [Flavobacteriales bacterium]|jgi:hypothetical protein|nr:hypothetical protein [Flavobacteriales bacterium]|tara:strand:+ start:868 stop:1875 length:1008 start_codon:yes stop_codon:yes gene_type:complete
MARDYTKYTVAGLGENLNKRQLVFQIVKDWSAKNKPSLEDIQKIFPDEIQGSKGFVVKASEVKDAKRFNMQEPLSIKNGTKVVVSNQWGTENISKFIPVAEKLGYTIDATTNKKTESSVSTKIDFTDFEIWKLVEFFDEKEGNEQEMDAIDEEIEALLDKNPKYYIVGKLFENYDYDYYREDINEYFSLGLDPNDFDQDDLYSLLRDDTLLSMMINKENLTETIISPSNTDFILLFSGYFIKALELLINTSNYEMIAEFIVNQSIQTIEGDFKVEAPMGDWLGDVTAELIENLYGYDIKDYDGECEVDGYYFGGQANTMGYDFHRYAQDIIDSLI